MKFKTVISDMKNTPYSDALDMGNLIQFSGMMGLDDNGLVKGGVIAETRQIFSFFLLLAMLSLPEFFSLT